MIYNLGPRAERVYILLRDRILSGELTPGTKLPPHTQLAKEFGVAALTMRQVLSHLEDDGLISREQGRGTFVQARTTPGVLIVEDDPQMSTVLSLHVRNAGYRPITASGLAEALAAFEQDRAIALVLSDIRIPTAADGVEFIRTVRRRSPELPVVAVTGHPDDLLTLHGTSECPILILTKPI